MDECMRCLLECEGTITNLECFSVESRRETIFESLSLSRFQKTCFMVSWFCSSLICFCKCHSLAPLRKREKWFEGNDEWPSKGLQKQVHFIEFRIDVAPFKGICFHKINHPHDCSHETLSSDIVRVQSSSTFSVTQIYKIRKTQINQFTTAWIIHPYDLAVRICYGIQSTVTPKHFFFCPRQILQWGIWKSFLRFSDRKQEFCDSDPALPPNQRGRFWSEWSGHTDEPVG